MKANTKFSHDYFLKIVPTIFRPLDRDPLYPFQFTYSYKSAQPVNPPPGLWFRYDVSPITVQYSQRHEPIYTFLGRTVAYIGGTFTVAGMIDSLIFTAGKALKKFELGKLS